MFEISDCIIGNINFTFLKTEAWHGKIINNQLRLSQEKAFLLKANNLSITNNTIETNTKGSIVINVITDLRIEDNDISNPEENPQGLHNIFHLGEKIWDYNAISALFLDFQVLFLYF